MLLYITAGVEGALLLMLTLYLLLRYAHKDAGWFVKFITFIGWMLGFSIITILPLDIYIVSENDCVCN